MKYFTYGEDLVDGLVGPFDTSDQARDHVDFCEKRGDADPGKVVTEEEAERLRSRPGGVGIEMTPEEDRSFDPHHQDDVEPPTVGNEVV